MSCPAKFALNGIKLPIKSSCEILRTFLEVGISPARKNTHVERWVARGRVQISVGFYERNPTSRIHTPSMVPAAKRSWILVRHLVPLLFELSFLLLRLSHYHSQKNHDRSLTPSVLQNPCGGCRNICRYLWEGTESALVKVPKIHSSQSQ